MDYLKLAKNSDAYALMKRDCALGKVAHAYLIVADDEKMASSVVSLFLADCAFGNESEVDRVERNGCADIIRLPHGEKVLTADIEDVTDTVYLTPTELNRKFYVIERAQTMNPTAQNKILKILEEPPQAVTIILIATTTKFFLPTVLSRVKKVEVEGLSDEVIAGLLERKYGVNNIVYLASAMAGGSLSKAEEVVKNPLYNELFDTVLNMFKGMKTSRNILHYSAKLMQRKDNLSDIIDIIEMILADCMLASAGIRDRLRFKNAVKDIIEISTQYTADVVIRLTEVIKRARVRMETNGNAQSVLDELLFSLLEVKAKCLRS